MAENELRYAWLTVERGWESGDERIGVKWFDVSTDAEAVAKVGDLSDMQAGSARLFAVAYEIEGANPLVGDEIQRRARAEHEKRLAADRLRAEQAEAHDRAEYERLRAKFGP